MRMCQIVLLAALFSGGCFASHGRSDAPAPPPPRPGIDAGTPRPPGLWDAGPPVISGCGDFESVRITRAEAAALHGALPPNRATEMEVHVDGGCFCRHELRCTATVTGPRTIDLVTEICDPGFDCSDCEPTVDGTCALPPLEEGEWTATVNGRDGFDFRVAAPTPGVPIPGRQVADTVAPVVEGGRVCPWPGDWMVAPSRICHPEARPAGEPFAVEVIDVCGGCFDAPGHCEVTVQDGAITVDPYRRRCECPACGVCEPECIPNTIECWVPPLPEGEHAIYLEGAGQVGVVTIGERGDEEVCSETLGG